MDLQRALDGAAATSLRIVGRIVGSGVTVPVDLLLTRSGAMRLQAIDDSERMVISNGSRLWVHGARGVFEADAWDTSIEGADDLLGALTAFDLVEALLPAPWPLLEQERTTTSMARTPEGLWVSTLAMSPAGRQVVRRRALIDPVDGRVLRRQRYDAAGNLELDVEGVAGPGASVSIGRPQEGAELTLQIDTLVHDPDLDIVSFTRS